jgi:hypothetical protein
MPEVAPDGNLLEIGHAMTRTKRERKLMAEQGTEQSRQRAREYWEELVVKGINDYQDLLSTSDCMLEEVEQVVVHERREQEAEERKAEQREADNDRTSRCRE